MSDQLYKHSSYHIYTLGNDLYGVMASRKVVLESGSLAQAFAILAKRYCLPIDQIEHALLKMCDRDHTMAEFNQFGTFIATLGSCKKAS